MVRVGDCPGPFTAAFTEIPGAGLTAEFVREREDLLLLRVSGALGSPAAVGDWRIVIRPDFVPDFTYTPHLTPSEENVIDMHVFRTPVLMMGRGDLVLCVMPVPAKAPDGENRYYMDLDVPAAEMTLGITTTRIAGHVLYERTDAAMLPAGPFRFEARILILRGKAAENPFRPVLAHYWQTCGRRDAGRLPGCGSLMPYVRHAYEWAFGSWKEILWQEFDLDGVRVGAPQFIVTARQSPNYGRPASIREHRSIWNQAWFSSLRSAQGLFRYGTETGNAELVRKARMTKELALRFPQRDGLFDAVIATPDETRVINGKPYVFGQDWDRHYFGNSDRNPVTRDLRGAPRHILDMSWTALMMLDWYAELERDERLVDYVRRYADRLIRLQDGDGFFPAWVGKTNGEPLETLRRSPECAVSVTMLLKLWRLCGEPAYRESALRCMDALMREVMPDSRWEDFETYWSCSSLGAEDMVGRKYARNNAYKQCSLSPFWMAQALLLCRQVTGEERYLRAGERCLDEMLMYQSSFQPDWIPVTVVGGFGVMNADAELNDQRQTLFAELILQYGRELGDREYTERGAAALRAGFSMMYCPENAFAKTQWEARWPFFGEADYGFMMENYGHAGTVRGTDLGIGEFTIYDWGSGSAAEAVMRIKAHFGELFA